MPPLAMSTTYSYSSSFLSTVFLEVLEKTLESPLANKEIKPVNPKGNQPSIFIGRSDAEAGQYIVLIYKWSVH